VYPSAKTAGDRDMQPFLAESRGLNTLNVMDLTNPRTTMNSSGVAKRMKS